MEVSTRLFYISATPVTAADAAQTRAPGRPARTGRCARRAAHPLVIADHTPEAALISLEVLRGVLLLLPRDFLKEALLRLHSIVRELSVLAEPQHAGNSAHAAACSAEPYFDPV